MIWLSEKRRLVAVLSILLVSGFFLTSIISFQVSKSALKESISQSALPLSSDNIYSEIQHDLLRPVFIASIMAQDTFLRDWVVGGEQGEEHIRKYLEEIRIRYGTVTSFFVSERTRTYYHAKGILKSVRPDDPNDKWFFRVRKMEPELEINVDLDKANLDTPTIFVNHKVFDYEGNFIGVTGIGLELGSMQRLIDHYHQKYRRNVYFTNEIGDVVLASQNEDQSQKKFRDIVGLHHEFSQIRTIKAKSLEYERNGESFLLASRYIPELDWVLLVEQSTSESIRVLKRTLFINLLLSLIVTAVVMIATFFVINLYQKRLEKMTEEEKFINTQLSQLNTQKDKMLSIIGHDLRSPFNAIIGYADLLTKNAGTLKHAQVVEYAENVAQCGRNANTLLDSLLGWAQSQWGDLTPKAGKVGLDEIFENNLALFRPVADVKGITLKLGRKTNTDVIADPDMVDLILRNLLNNAIKFTNIGGSVSVEAHSDNGFSWVSVVDTGVGISPDALKKIFESTGVKSTKGTVGEAGVGMGLLLSRDMVEANGGTISVESEPGHGTRFYFSLPLA